MLTSPYLNKEECKMKYYFSRIWAGILITLLSFSFTSSSYAIDIKLWDLSARQGQDCLLYTSPSPRDSCASRMPSSA